MADKDYKAFIVEGEAREPQVIDNISKEIQVMLNSGNKSKMATAQGFQTQLASISGRAESIQSTQQNIFNAMDMISVSNKYALGL